MTKGAETRERIVDAAYRLATRDGFDGVTIGALADELQLSKSGLFAHFGSKEDLQVAVLDVAQSRFTERVLLPAFRAPRGLPRLERVFENWVGWLTDHKNPGGCIFAQAIPELDDHEGRPREVLVEQQHALNNALITTVQLAIDAGHLRPETDASQLVFEIMSLMTGYSLFGRLLRDRKAPARLKAAFAHLLHPHLT